MNFSNTVINLMFLYTFTFQANSHNQNNGNHQITMTGKQRQAYDKWKNERDQIDEEWEQQKKDSEGKWRRPWDSEKTPE